MAISVSLALDPGIILVGQAKRAQVTVSNTEGFDIDILGIDIQDNLRSLTCGDLIPGLPVTFDVNTFTTPIVSQVPAWGTALQSSKTITGVDLTYPVANFATVTQTITNDKGSYSGGSATPNIVRIPTGTSMTSFVNIISSGVGILQTALAVTLTTTVQALVSSTGAALTPAIASPVSTVISTTPVRKIQLSSLGGPSLLVKNVWARPPEYNNFDLALQTLLEFTNDTTLNVTGLPGHVFSSDNANWTVVPSIVYSATTPAAIPSIANATPSFPVGSIPPGGWLGTQLLGGAGACTTAASTNSILSSTITDLFLGAYTSTIVISHVNRVVVGLSCTPVLTGLTGVGNSVDLLTRFLYNDGSFSASLEGSGTPPTYAIIGANTGLVSVNATTGIVTQNIAGPSSVTISSTVTYNDGTGARPIVAYAIVQTS